jgi:hypothetical protein
VLDDLGLAAAVRSSVAEFETVTPTVKLADVEALEADTRHTEIVSSRLSRSDDERCQTRLRRPRGSAPCEA